MIIRQTGYNWRSHVCTFCCSVWCVYTYMYSRQPLKWWMYLKWVDPTRFGIIRDDDTWRRFALTPNNNQRQFSQFRWKNWSLATKSAVMRWSLKLICRETPRKRIVIVICCCCKFVLSHISIAFLPATVVVQLNIAHLYGAFCASSFSDDTS